MSVTITIPEHVELVQEGAMQRIEIDVYRDGSGVLRVTTKAGTLTGDDEHTVSTQFEAAEFLDFIRQAHRLVAREE